MHDGERAYYVTDSSLASLVESLSRRAVPLLAHSGGDDSSRARTSGSIAITEAGRQVLSGTPDVAGMRRDRSVDGQVHLGPGRIWRWDPARKTVAEW